MMHNSPDEDFQTLRHRIQVFRHGTERQPVVVIDQFLDDPDAMVELAACGPVFAPNGLYYPGIRAPVPENQLANLVAPLNSVLTQVFGYNEEAILQECNFSLVTTLPQNLMPIQRLPHFDGLEYGRVAALLFLDKSGQGGGTAFYQQRSTGFETVDAGRYKQFSDALNRDVDRLGMPAQEYVADNNPMYETLAMHEGRFNRMLVYNSATLHSGRLPTGFNFSADPRRGRLTVNAFLGMKS